MPGRNLSYKPTRYFAIAEYLHMRKTHKKPSKGQDHHAILMCIHLWCWMLLYPCSCTKRQREGGIQGILGKRRRVRGKHICAQQ